MNKIFKNITKKQIIIFIILFIIIVLAIILPIFFLVIKKSSQSSQIPQSSQLLQCSNPDEYVWCQNGKIAFTDKDPALISIKTSADDGSGLYRWGDLDTNNYYMTARTINPINYPNAIDWTLANDYGLLETKNKIYKDNTYFFDTIIIGGDTNNTIRLTSCINCINNTIDIPNGTFKTFIIV